MPGGFSITKIFWMGGERWVIPQPSLPGLSGQSMENLKMEKKFYVYILSNAPNGTLYIGVTSDLQKRIWEHKNAVAKGFTQKYDVKALVYFEIFDDAENAIKREKRLKKYKRDWKINLIEEQNPHWEDLYESICN
jgi:putative endonuclease